MARGGRGGRGGRGSRGRRERPRGGQGRPELGRPTQLPTAAPGAAGAPRGAAAFGSRSITVGQPRLAAERPRGGPRGRSDRRARAAAALHDFRYVGADLRWIGLTTVVSVALVLVLWAVTRL